MTFEEFSLPFEKLSTFFTIRGEETKCKAYYSYFDEKKLEPWKRTVEYCVKKKKTFPTLSECLEIYEIFNEEILSKECDVCSGSGWVYAKGVGNEVRRSPCIHGDRLSKQYAGPTYEGERSYQVKPNPDEVDYRWAKMMVANQKRFLSGLRFTGPILRHHRPDIFQRIVELAREGIGEHYAQEIEKIKPRAGAL